LELYLVGLTLFGYYLQNIYYSVNNFIFKKQKFRERAKLFCF